MNNGFNIETQKKMTLYFITKHFQARRVDYDEEQNILWLDPNFKERFLKRQQVGFNLNLLRLIEEYPALSKKVEIGTPLVYFTLHLKDMKVAIGVDEEGVSVYEQIKSPRYSEHLREFNDSKRAEIKQVLKLLVSWEKPKFL